MKQKSSQGTNNGEIKITIFVRAKRKKGCWKIEPGKHPLSKTEDIFPLLYFYRFLFFDLGLLFSCYLFFNSFLPSSPRKA